MPVDKEKMIYSRPELHQSFMTETSLYAATSPSASSK